MTLGYRLTAATLVLAALVLGLSVFCFQTVRGLADALDTTVTRNVQKTDIIAGIRADFGDMLEQARIAQLASMAHLIDKMGDGHGRQLGCSGCHDESRIESSQAELRAIATRAKGRIVQLRPILVTVEGKQATDAIDRGISEWLECYQLYIGFAKSHDFDKEHEVLTERIIPLLATIEKASTKLITRQRELVAASAETSRQSATRSRWLALGFILLCVAMTVACVSVIRSSSRTLRRLTSDLCDAAGSVDATASDISGTSRELSEGASQQVAALDQAAAAADQIRSTAAGNSDRAGSAAEVTASVGRGVQEANQTLLLMTEAMEKVRASSRQVAQITKVIDEIAFQTNLLALNASVEAARAGQAGAGFAVVAEQVRALAQRCSQAAKDTSQLIAESLALSQQGRTHLDSVTRSVHTVTSGTEQVTTLANQVRAGSKEQALATNQIAEVLGAAGRITRTVSETANRNAAAGAQLTAGARDLGLVVGELTALVGTGDASA